MASDCFFVNFCVIDAAMASGYGGLFIATNDVTVEMYSRSQGNQYSTSSVTATWLAHKLSVEVYTLT